MAEMEPSELPQASSLRMDKVVFCLHGLITDLPLSRPQVIFIIKVLANTAAMHGLIHKWQEL